MDEYFMVLQKAFRAVENNGTLKMQRDLEKRINQKQENRTCCIIYLSWPLMKSTASLTMDFNGWHCHMWVSCNANHIHNLFPGLLSLCQTVKSMTQTRQAHSITLPAVGCETSQISPKVNKCYSTALESTCPCSHYSLGA